MTSSETTKGWFKQITKNSSILFHLHQVESSHTGSFGFTWPKITFKCLKSNMFDHTKSTNHQNKIKIICVIWVN